VPRQRNSAKLSPNTESALSDLTAALEASAKQLRNSERFRPALARYCSAMVGAAPAAWPVYKLFDQIDRYIVSYMLIHNYYCWRNAGGPAPTLSALQRIVGTSARHTAGLVAAMKIGHLILSERPTDDRRIQHLRPAPAMVREIGRSVLLFVAAADEIEGHPGNRMLEDVSALGDLLHRSAAYVLRHGTLIHPFPRIFHFAKRDCGYLILTAVLDAHYRQAFPGEDAAASLSYRALARRFQVSPAHIGNLLSEAEHHGWFATGPGGRLAAIDMALVTEFEQWASWQMIHYADLVRAKSA